MQDAAPAREAAPVGEGPRIGWRDRVKALSETGDDGYADDDPWFGKNAAGAGYAQTSHSAEPTF
ncbi:hypothetical protein [Pseudarthrobacter sp. fls2-241-R2A-168]|uniref:hypothetical protein n=1 Tax=Pseudarthrobacter sp. fls2-241-R2A-168 TaxID=3040304 RepID=UPI002553F6FC|nr:hypothetical protein [Pseudarthrobacter sp. fls2-241-R2A-168]